MKAIVARGGALELSFGRMNSQAPLPLRPVILYDGVCALCNFWVLFVLKRDRRQRYLFAALQSEAAKSLLQEHGVDVPDLSTIIVVYPDRVALRSDAALSILSDLGFPWALSRYFRVLPRFVRDSIYNLIARARYRIFGKHEVCPLPPAEVRDRFIDQS